MFLSVDNIKMLYQTPDSETEAVRNISFSVGKGEFVSLVGPSGCGKSTLLSAIAGLRPVQNGKILVEGADISQNRSKIGYMFQNDNLLSWRSIYKNVLLGLEVRGRLDRESIAYAENLLKKYDLWQFRNSYPGRLSGGMRQRVALIRTLALKPDLLLLDEAFSALDYQTRVSVSGDVYRILKEERKTLVMVTHDIPEAVVMSDKIVVFSPRPAVVQKEIAVDFGCGIRDPIAVRSDARFQKFFNAVWKELTV